jgi:DMSO/TMAO reductase YedYZ molybdopterin-dependent catalytic subunit
VITPKMFGDRGRRRAEKLGIDPDRLPPGQSPTVKFPVFTFSATPDVATAELTVDGHVAEPFTLSDASFRALPHVEQTSDFHCVTRWSQFDMRFGGVRARDLLEPSRPLPGASHVVAHGLDGYTTNLPLEVVLADEVLIADSFDGAPLTRDHGFPRRLLVPARYGWKSAKWLHRIEVLDHDEPGFWERNGYHHNGDPWREERHGPWR